ncbi:MAG TPA: mobile mystery protein A [Streptosporangiaceae bacterium]|jgi:predicted DNA-binding mobile mystery protein A|nr:mobile mystery protein A [Streptosporangiaceae bacterium]
MVGSGTSSRARRSLDMRLSQLGAAARYQAPQSGWVRAIRDALGMSAAELGRRMGVTGPAVSALERSEREDTARLETLRRAAAAMDCTLVYMFVPNRGLEETVQEHAQQMARSQLAHVANTMALEDQAVNVDDRLVQEQAAALIRIGRVWTEQP